MPDRERCDPPGDEDDEPLGRLGDAVTALVRKVLAQQQRQAGSSSATLEQMLVFGDGSRLHVHPTAKVNNALFNLSSGEVHVGEYAFFGHNVSVLTGTHDITKFGAQRQNAIPADGHDIVIGAGVWVASNATIVGPCTIGANAVVAVGSLVLDDVDPYAVVAGSPARVIRVIDHEKAPLRLEIGSGEFPALGYDIHVDILALGDVTAVCAMDRLPFRDGCFGALRAHHILEHQSYELVERTVAEWVRVLQPDASVEIGVPDARCRAGSWLRGEITTEEANYWILGGHSDRAAHQGTDTRGVPRWIYNAHHTLFDPGSLRRLLESCGLVDVIITPEDTCNLRANGRLAQ